jgi:hypothetical protein
MPSPIAADPWSETRIAMFAAFVQETDPLLLRDLPAGMLAWIQVAGGFAAFFVVLWAIVGTLRYLSYGEGSAALAAVSFWPRLVLAMMNPHDRATAVLRRVYLGMALVGLSIVCYVAGGTGFLLSLGADEGALLARTGRLLRLYGLVCGGLCAILVVCLPFLRNIGSMRLRRVYALAKLSFKESIRRKVLYAFGSFLLVFLFASWFIPSKPEDQVRTYVTVMYQTMSILLLFVAVLVSAFSIPTDIKQQTIHTIVTKPVERFEVVLGRFLGFLALMTIVLLVMTTVSLFMVRSGVTPEAADESLKAREPLYGELRFENTDSEKKATNVGREWDYRSYITMPNPGQLPQIARYDFAAVPRSLGTRDQVLCEYTFDIYRTTKGDEGRDVSCSFKFYTWRYQRGNDESYRKERGPYRDAKKESELAEKYGYYEINALPVTDFHTQSFYLPGGLFRNASAEDSVRAAELKQADESRPPPLRAKITCDSGTQYVGMARYDFYVRLDDAQGWEKLHFSFNFFKAAYGLWLRLALIIGLAVILSTQLSGVVSLLLALLLYVGGVSRDFILEVARGVNPGGGPLEAIVRMSRRELTGASMADSAATTEQIVNFSDTVFRFVIRVLFNVIPDVDTSDMTARVSEGFNISGEQMIVAGVLMFGYLLPWAVLGFWFIKWREVANPN